MTGDACVTQGSVECVMHSSASAGVGAEQKYIVCILYVHALHSQMVLEPTHSKARKKLELPLSGESQFSGYLVASLIFPQCKTS